MTCSLAECALAALCAFFDGLLKLLVRQNPDIGIGRTAVAGSEVQLFHVGRRLLAPVIGELLGVIVSGPLRALGTGDDVVHQIEREQIRLLVVAAGRNFAGGTFDHHASVKLRDRRELLWRHPVVDDRLDRVDMRCRKVVLVEGL